ncbi:MAG: hypothetical protein ACLFNP_06360, partial [Spirochaetaceae bacterium]
MSSAPLYNHVSEGGELKLAVRTGVTTGTFAVTQLVSQERDPGWIVHGEGMESWHIEGFRHLGGLLYFYGPDLPVTPFETLLLDSAQNKPRLEAAVLVYRAVRRLAQAEVELPALSLTGIFLTDEEGVFIAPPRIVAKALTHLPESSELAYVEHHTHPDLQGEPRDAMAFGVWVYRILTGSWPFPGESVAEIRDRFRSSPPRPPRALRPTLDATIAEALENLLAHPSSDAAEVLIERLGTVKELDVKRTPEEDEEVRLREERRWGEGTRKLRHRRYLSRNWKKLLLVGVIVVVVLSVPISILRRALEPSPLEGRSLTEVTRSFYYAMNDFDHVLMEEAVIQKAAEDKLREVTNLYVFSRMQGAMEGRSRFVDAQTWRDDGMPELRPGHHAYGVANLRILSARHEGEQATVTVRYEKWEPAAEREEQEPGEAVSLDEARAEESNSFENMLFYVIEERLQFVFR